MYFKTPVQIPYETKRIVQITSPNGDAILFCTLHDNSEAREKGQPFRKAIGKACPDNPDMMHPCENYFDLFPDKCPENPDPELAAYLNTHYRLLNGRLEKLIEVRLPETDEEKQRNLERRRQGLPYWCNDASLFAEQHVYQDKMTEYNRTMPTETDRRQALLKEIFAEIGEDCIVETPVNSNWGCHNVHLGSGVYINSNATFVDDADICIGDNCLIGTGVTFCTAGHPVLPEMRENDYQYELPIRIGRNVWIGSNAIIMPGVTVGDNSVIGAGSVVTKDIPANVVAYGVPCKVQREIGSRDKVFYYKDLKFPKD